jgi:hypothetical protein
MTILLQVKWMDVTDQPEPHLRIGHIGGASRQWRWKHTQAQAVEFIASGQFTYYVEKDARSLRLDVARTNDGRQYLALQPDAGLSLSLIGLPACPVPTRDNPAET